MVRRSFLALLATAALAAALPASAAAQQARVRIRVIKGSRQGPPHMDPRLNDQKRQLSALAYQRWEQIDERDIALQQGKPQFVAIPDGNDAAVTLQEQRGNTVTIEVGVVAQNTQSTLTVEKGQRIVHQVTPERNGSAFFLTVLAWP